MIFKLHYWCVAAGSNSLGILLGVFVQQYTDASPSDVGLLYMVKPFCGIISKPLICSLADRTQAHQRCILICLFITALGYLPFVLIPCLGPVAYKQHPQLCWYVLVGMKVIGDTAYGGVTTIGNTLAINYAKRINVSFSVYRIWGTFSWMFFGIVIGQLNEVWFLPKYVPGFIILITSTLLNMTAFWLWPREYFRMVPHHDISNPQKSARESKVDQMAKSLLPRRVVWNYAKRRLLSVLTCSCFRLDDEDDKITSNNQSNFPVELTVSEFKSKNTELEKQQEKNIDKRTQLKILATLIRRDPRIVFYLLMFVCAGFAATPLSFFFMSLSDVCEQDDRCNFSQLAGFLQVSMAITEILLFLCVSPLMDAIGRLNTISISFAIAATKYALYATLYYHINPHYALLFELLNGIMLGIFVTVTVESGHLFAGEVKFIMAELIGSGTIDENTHDCDRVKMSLAATMQALIACAMDGFGCGLSSLIYGLILDNFSYQFLWMVVSLGSLVVLTAITLANLLAKLLDLRLGAERPDGAATGTA